MSGQTWVVEDPRPTTVEDEKLMLLHYCEELDGYRAQIIDFPNQDPADILATLSGISGRVTEIRAQLYRLNTQRCTALRTREVDPLRDELEFQFKVTSRRIALMEWELKMSGGGI